MGVSDTLHDMVISFWLILIALAFLIPTGYAAVIGAPYAPTKIAPVRLAFDMLQIGAQDVVIDLGVGDGKIVLEAGKRGAKAIGFELSPIMYAVAWWRFRGKKNIELRYGNFFKKPIAEATVLFAFLMPKHMKTVEKFIAKRKSEKLRYVLIYAFPFKDLTPIHVIREKKCAPLYIYEAQSL